MTESVSDHHTTQHAIQPGMVKELNVVSESVPRSSHQIVQKIWQISKSTVRFYRPSSFALVSG